MSPLWPLLVLLYWWPILKSLPEHRTPDDFIKRDFIKLRCMYLKWHVPIIPARWPFTHCGLVTPWRHRSWSTLIHIMTCYLTKPLPEAMLTCKMCTMAITPEQFPNDEILMISICKMRLKFTLLSFLPCLPGSIIELSEIVEHNCIMNPNPSVSVINSSFHLPFRHGPGLQNRHQNK